MRSPPRSNPLDRPAGCQPSGTSPAHVLKGRHANRLGLSTKAVRGLIARGELPAYKVAGRIRIDPAEREGTWATTHAGHLAPKTRHSYVWVYEGRSVIYVGHGANLTMSTYGHVIEELEDQPQLSAEDAIRQARTRLVPLASGQ
jgi:hypothetical protein